MRPATGGTASSADDRPGRALPVGVDVPGGS
jgi:hypothetical protein